MSKELRTWKWNVTLALFLGVFTLVLVFVLLLLAHLADPKAGGSVVSLGGGGLGIGLYLIWSRKGFGSAACFRHPDKRMVASCSSCDRHFCRECLQQINSRYYCKFNETCVSAFAAASQRSAEKDASTI